MHKIPLLILCLITVTCFGQDNAVNYNTKDGLPSNQVYDIYQDQRGIMWFATDRGLSSFNGSFFTNFTIADGLLSDVIFDFFPQKNGTVWCSTDKNKLFLFDPAEQTFTPFKFNHLLPNNLKDEIKALHIDQGNYYVRFKGQTGYLKIRANGKVEKHELDKTEFGSAKYYLKCIKNEFYYYSLNKSGALNENPLAGGNRDLIAKMGENVARISFEYVDIINAKGLTKRVKLIENGELLQLGSTGNSVWVAGYNIGVKLIDQKGMIYQTYFPELPCSKYFKDKDNSVWISTLSDGVFLVPASKIKSLKVAKNEYITSLSVYKNDLAYGTHTGLIVEVSVKNSTVKTNKASAKGIVQYHGGKLYSNNTTVKESTLGYYTRRISDNEKERLIATGATSIFDTTRNWHVVTGSQSVFDAEVMDNNYYLVSEGTCIKIYNTFNQVIDSVDLFTRVLDVDVINDQIYCATSTKGLIILNKKLKTLTVVDLNSGLKSNYINDVKLHNGDIWLATRNGISKVVNAGTNKQVVTTIGVIHGLSDQEVMDFDFMGDTLFLGTSRGINYLQVSKWEEIVQAKTFIFFSIKKISQQGQKLESTENLAYYQNDLTFEIELASFQINKEILFRYKLKGLDNEWSNTRSRMINFKSLPPGSYELLIQANVNDYWHDQIIRQKIHILPAWYTTWWFIGALVIFVCTIVWLFFKYRILNYNREIFREILRHTLKRIKKKDKLFVVRSNGRDIKMLSENIVYVESSRNYITIYTTGKKVVVREKISNFLSLVPDPLEYIQINRSVIVRIDHVKSKGKDTITISEQEIKVGGKYVENLKKIHF